LPGFPGGAHQPPIKQHPAEPGGGEGHLTLLLLAGCGCAMGSPVDRVRGRCLGLVQHTVYTATGLLAALGQPPPCPVNAGKAGHRSCCRMVLGSWQCSLWGCLAYY
jgi:hypothetical protein